jgi:lipopolysaccharide biosynthesis regulator YciM
MPFMELDLAWILLGLPVAFGLGWMASRLDLRQLRIENRHNPKAYFKGLNHLLNEQQDQAIDAFIEAVQQDPDTSELHFALGNLFRRRGEFERAVRVHQHLLSRADLSNTDRDRAQHALALDFLKAGLLDRAEESLRKLDSTAFHAQAQLALLSIYERSRDWVHAADIAQKLAQSGQGHYEIRQAHYLCEQAGSLATTDPAQAEKLLKQAITLAPQAARATLALALLEEKQQRPQHAYELLLSLAQRNPGFLPLVAQRLARLAIQLGHTPQAQALLNASYEANPSLDVLDALVNLDVSEGCDTARDWYARHLEREPSLVAASQWVAREKLTHEERRPALQRALERAATPLKRYRCAACGFEAQQHFWQCPGCQSWDSYPPRRIEEL